MSALQAIVIAILQGATELFPVSSLGHAVVLPALLHWPIDQRSPEFLPFLVMLHLGTATALLLFFWRDWWSLAIGVLGLASPHQIGESRRVFMLIVVATLYYRGAFSVFPKYFADWERATSQGTAP